MDFLFDGITLYRSYLDYLRAKDRVITSNIANAETPFYKRLKVELEGEENNLPLKVTNPRHMTNVPVNPFAYRIVQDREGLTGEDGNNVNLEREMVELEKVALGYEAAMKFVTGKFSSLELVIKGGGQ